MCTCFPVGHCIPESQHPCVPAVSLPSRLTSADEPVLALGAELMEARRSLDTPPVPSHAAQPWQPCADLSQSQQELGSLPQLLWHPQLLG